MIYFLRLGQAALDFLFLLVLTKADPTAEKGRRWAYDDGDSTLVSFCDVLGVEELRPTLMLSI